MQKKIYQKCKQYKRQQVKTNEGAHQEAGVHYAYLRTSPQKKDFVEQRSKEGIKS